VVSSRTVGIREPACLVNTIRTYLPNQAPYSFVQGTPQRSTDCSQRDGGLCLLNHYKYEPSPRYCQPPRPSPCHPFDSGATRSNLPGMPDRLRNSTRVANNEPTSSSAASSAALEQNRNEPTLGTPETRRHKRGLGGSSEEIACELHLPRIGSAALTKTPVRVF
jgi:hypothetical protein